MRKLPASNRLISETGEYRMIRLPLVAGLAVGLLLVSKPLPAQDAKNPGVSPQTQKINELIAQGWEKGGVKKPADKANDFEFIRRAFIDLIGRVPTIEEIRDF